MSNFNVFFPSSRNMSTVKSELFSNVCSLELREAAISMCTKCFVSIDAVLVA